MQFLRDFFTRFLRPLFVPLLLGGLLFVLLWQPMQDWLTVEQTYDEAALQENDEQSGYFHTEKVSYQMNPENRFVGFYQFYNKNQQSGVTQFTPWEARTNFITDSHTGKLEWQHVKGNAVISLQYGNWGYSVVYPNNAPGKVRTTDQVTLFVTGPMATAGQRPYNTRHEPKGSIAWYIPDGYLGKHELKAGFASMINAGARPYPLNEDTQPYNYSLTFQNNVAFQMQATTTRPNRGRRRITTACMRRIDGRSHVV